jgi:hypothetical protein
MICRKHLALALLACCPVLTAQAAADPLSSSYWEAAYLNTELEVSSGTTTSDDEVEGFRGAVSIGLLPYLNFVADYDQERYAESREGFGSVGLVGHTLDPVWQAFGGVTYERHDFDVNRTTAGDSTEEGYGVLGGARVTIPFTEFRASAKYLAYSSPSVDVDLTGMEYGGGVTLDLTPWWSLVGDYSVRQLQYEAAASTTDRDYTQWSVGLRRYLATKSDPHKRTGGVFGFLFTGDESQ